MPIKIPTNLPATDVLIKERILVLDEDAAMRQDIRPMRVAVLNLMPDKITTETQLARVLGATPLQVELTLLRTGSYVGKNTQESHLFGFYKVWDDVKHQKFDMLIVTGAPVETMDFDSVQYWGELTQILDWSATNVFSTMFICWGAQAALNHFHGINKTQLDKKKFGVFMHERLDFYHPLTRGFDDHVHIPVSRHTESNMDAILANDALKPLLRSDETGLSLLHDEGNRRIYMFNHLEYDRETLANEYQRDIKSGSDIDMPKNYFQNDDPDTQPAMNWRAHRNLLFANWMNLVYQDTPYNLDDLGA